MERHTARSALILLSGLGIATVCTAQTTDTPTTDDKPKGNDGWGIEVPGFTFDVGTGMYGAHFRTTCPRYLVKGSGGEADQVGCTGTEPVNYVSHSNPITLNLTLGYRFNRYLALNFPLTIYGGRANVAAHQTALEQGITMNAITDIGIRLRGTLPLTKQWALFGTIGLGLRSIHGSIDEPVGTGAPLCVSYGQLPNPGAPEGFGNERPCLEYKTTSTNTPFSNSSSLYMPLSGGVQWYPFQYVGFAVSYQPPISKGGIATSEIQLSVLTSMPE